MKFLVLSTSLMMSIILVGMIRSSSIVSRQADSPPETASVPVPAELAAVRRRVLDRIRRREAPSFAVGVVKNGKVIWEEGLGWADRERKIATTWRQVAR